MIDVLSIFKKMISEYEQLHGELIFTFCKSGREFIHTFVNKRLAETVQLQPGDIVNQTLQSPYISADLAEQLHVLYERAWSGYTTLYYFIPETNKEIFLVVLLQPRMQGHEVLEVAGRCVPLQIGELKEAVQLLQQYNPLKVLGGE